jgi:hypothetical protein
MKTPHATLPRLIIILAGFGLATLLGGCGLFSSGPNVIHVGSGLQWDASQLGRHAATGQTSAEAAPSGQLTEATSGQGHGS